MPDLHIVILAAGKGTRMKSERPKVLHEIGGRPLIGHVLRTAAALGPTTTTIVIGHQGELLKSHLAAQTGLSFATQEPQIGTGHALLQTEPLLENAQGTLVMLSGDVPQLRPATLERLVRHHQDEGAAATVLTATVDQPDGYGRVLRDEMGISAIVEHRDASADQRAIGEINSGIYAFDLGPLFGALKRIGSANAQREYYLPDLVKIYRAEGRRVATVRLDDAREILGINSRRELADVAEIMKTRKNDELMAAGVTILDPASTFIEADVEVGADTVIHPHVQLQGTTRIGSGCEIQSSVRIVDSVVGDNVLINNFCLIIKSTVANGAQVGPFVHIRPQSQVGEDAHIGNFVELKKTAVGRGSKANHLSYLGDATIGEKVNVGAGTITCNYDGVAKHPTVIEDGAFIGSDSQLIAPVRIGRGAYIAAGSSITDDVPADALGIARGKQVNKEGWVKRKKG